MQELNESSSRALEAISEAFRVRWKHREQKKDDPAAEFFYKMMSETYRRFVTARAENRGSTISVMYGPIEIYNTMDISALLVEDFCLISGALGEAVKYFESAEGIGFPGQTCRCAALEVGLAVERVIPVSDFVTSVGFLCDACETPMWNIARLYNIPEVNLDCGYGTRDERTIDYYKGQLVDFVKFVENFYKKKMDRKRFREVLESSKVAADSYFKMNQLRTSTPCPISARSQIKDYSLMLNCAGRPELAEYMKWRYGQIQERVDKGVGVIPEERHRIFWIAAYPFFDLRISDFLAQEHKAVVVGDFFDSYCFNATLDNWVPEIDDPFDYIARKTLNYPGARCNQQFDDYMPDIVEFCKQAKVDTAVFYGNFGCKNLGGVRRAWGDRLKKECGVTTVYLDGDILDPRVASPQQLRDQLNKFFEVIDR